MDLSKVLDDVYETKQGSVPEWSDEQRLDEVFAQWTPGPPADAPAAEREMATHVATDVRLDDDLAAALTQALAVDSAVADPVPAFPEAEPEPDSVVSVLYAELAPGATSTPAAPARWVRGDDDISFGGREGRSRPRRSRR